MSIFGNELTWFSIEVNQWKVRLYLRCLPGSTSMLP
jgi:hypothetical protein